ncbi:Glycerophosphodiester phosphodiesterase [Nymphaea thermarum]|nr:Glycerophosphodiester phosphodiesterase [Nymphaea thermarum]
MRLVLTGFLLLLLVSAPLFVGAQKAGSNSTRAWKTLTGSRPVVVARGGFSGLVPDSSVVAYQLGQMLSSPDGVSWCDVQLAKDAVGLCVRDLNLANSTNIQYIFPNGGKTYDVNGVSMTGWFTVDYDSSVLTTNISLVQGIFSRSSMFDQTYGILTVDVLPKLNVSHVWLNVEHDVFFTEHKLNMTAYILTISKNITVNYVSSPEVGFLRSIARSFNGSKTKLILTFPDSASIDPSTKLSYDSYLKNLTFVKTFASGILVPKSYIWPTGADQYLLPHTSLVLDAHAAGLVVFASGFANDNALSYNYTYDPVVEYLSYLNSTDFSVDGVLSDFPVTAEVAIGKI